jgi:hypothetical protein
MMLIGGGLALVAGACVMVPAVILIVQVRRRNRPASRSVSRLRQKP